MSSVERKHSLHLYLNDDELDILENKCKLANVKNKSDFVRQLITDGYIIEVNFSELNRYNYLLGKISTNINQIAHRINETRSIYQNDIDHIKEEIEKIWQLQRSMVSKIPLAKR